MSDDADTGVDVIAELNTRCPGWRLLLADATRQPLVIVQAKRVVVVDIGLPAGERARQVRRAIATIEAAGGTDYGDAELVLY